MKSFKEHMLTEARSRGEAMEEVIVAAINGKPKGNRRYGIEGSAGVKVANFLKDNGVHGKAKVLGPSPLPVTKEWSIFWPEQKVPTSTRTPKTDFVVGSSKISLKSGRSAHLMSGGKNESIATFYAAVSRSSNIEESMANRLSTLFNEIQLGGVTRGDLKTVIAQKSDEIVTAAKDAHQKLMQEIKNAFDQNRQFRNAFAYEAMTGDTKFGGSLGTCTHLLVSTYDGEQIAVRKASDDSYVTKIADQMSVSVAFKSRRLEGAEAKKRGEYKYWSVLSLILDRLHEDVANMDENMLAESRVMSFLKGVWNQIKEAFQKAAAYVRKSVKNLFDFLDIEPEVTFDNQLNFGV